jgi:hypothetical protein
MGSEERDALAIAEHRIEEARRSGSVELFLEHLGLATVPDAVGRLTNLQVLDLSRNQLTALPEAITRLTNLQSLNLSPAHWPNPNDAWRTVAANLRAAVARR